MKTCYWKLQDNKDDQACYKEAAAYVQQGELVAFPTETVYGLGANGLNGQAVTKIYQAKGRPSDNPLILHIAAKEDILPLTSGLNNNAIKLMESFMPGPITLVVPKSAIIPDEVSAGLDTVGIRFPGNKYAQAFIKACGCPIAAPSANTSGRPSPTNAQDVLEDMDGKIAGILDGGSCGIGLESTVVDTTTPVPTILRPGGITYEMLTEVMGAVEIDPALQGNPALKPKAPGMKYRHYAPEAAMYLLEDRAAELLPELVLKAGRASMKVGVLCSNATAERLVKDDNLIVASWGAGREELAADLFQLLRDFDRTKPDIILAEGISEEGIGLAIMNRMRKAAGYQIITLSDGVLSIKNGLSIPKFMVE